ncbi:MAG: outer membrane beta-barrel protein [Gemmatimonadales bacterium]
MRRSFLSLGLVLAVVGPAAGQQVRLAPQFGLYVPTEQLYDLAAGSASSDDFKLEAGPAFGARLGVWFGQRFGIELGGNYVPTTFAFGAGGGTTKQDAKLFTGTGQAVVFLLPPSGLLSLFASAGVAVISRGGVAFTSEAKTTNLGGVLGVGAAVRLGPIGLTVGADLLGYTADYQGTQAVSRQVTQRDVNIKVGFGVPFGGGGSAGRMGGGR